MGTLEGDSYSVVPLNMKMASSLLVPFIPSAFHSMVEFWKSKMVLLV